MDSYIVDKVNSFGLKDFKCESEIKPCRVKKINLPAEIAPFIDHTILKSPVKKEDIVKLCAEAERYKFYSVCVNNVYIEEAKKRLLHSSVKVCGLVDFPLGMTDKQVKAKEAKNAIELGADELDMVMPVGLLKSGEYARTYEHIRKVVESAGKIPVKIIIEACLLKDGEKTIACLLAKKAGAAFVKTSTGFSTGGAVVEDVKLMRNVVGSDLGVKAAGGIKDYNTAKALIEAGANRIGSSASALIVNLEGIG